MKKPFFKLKQISMAIGISTAILSFTTTAANLPTPYIHDLAPIEDVNESLNGLIPVELGQAELAAYYGNPPDPKKVALIQKLVEAGKIMDILFMKQLNVNNVITDSNGVVTGGILKDLQNPQYDIDSAYLNLFKIHYSQWDAGNGYTPFINTDETIPDGIELYPKDISSEEWANYEEDPLYTYDFTVIRRNGSGLVAIPYANFGAPGSGYENEPGNYYNDLQKAAQKLEEAAVIAGELGETSLQTYLHNRALAFKNGSTNTDIYVESDKNWVEIDSDVDITIGPYEQYLDSIAGVKAMFMTMLGIRDKVATASLKYLEDPVVRDYLIAHMPYPSICGANKNQLCTPADHIPALGAKLRVMNEVFSAGDYRGTSALAFFLPNNADSSANGAKNTMIKNVNEASYEKRYAPLAKLITKNVDFAKINFPDFFNYVVTHEVGHSTTPKSLPSGADVTAQLGRWGTTIEEELADTISSWYAFVLHKAGNSLGAGNPFANVNLDNFVTTAIVTRMRGMGLDSLNVSSHIRGRVIGFDHVIHFVDPCNPARHAVTFSKKGVIYVDTKPIETNPVCKSEFKGEPLIIAAIHSLGKRLMAIELGSDASTTKDIEAARNMYACAKERLYGTPNTQSTNPALSSRSSEPCCPDGLETACLRGSPEQIKFPQGNAEWLQAIDKIENSGIPGGLSKIYPGLD